MRGAHPWLGNAVSFADISGFLDAQNRPCRLFVTSETTAPRRGRFPDERTFEAVGVLTGSLDLPPLGKDAVGLLALSHAGYLAAKGAQG